VHTRRARFSRRKMFFLSGVIFGTILLQAAASSGILGERFWPFLNYPMYRKPHYQGENISTYRLVGILRDASEIPILPEDLHLNFWKFKTGPVAAIRLNEAALLRRYMGGYQARHPDLTAVRLEDHPKELTERGVVDAPAKMVGTMRLSSRESSDE
jgi:hypothetical protein